MKAQALQRRIEQRQAEERRREAERRQTAESKREQEEAARRAAEAEELEAKPRLRTRAKYGIAAGVVGVIAAIALAAHGTNHAQLQAPLKEVFQEDYRNDQIEGSVHYGGFVNPSVLVFDLTNVPGDKSRLDVFRVFLQFAEKMQHKRFETVELAFRGRTKFTIDGDYFQTLGREYDYQNPAYTIRTFPEHLKTSSGLTAYPEWSGGILGVLQKQMEDFNEFHDEWWLSDLQLEL